LETYNNENITFINSDATNLLQLENNSIESLSALCSLEHFGLGRYGDTIDPLVHLKAFDSIQRVMKPEGNIYIVPVQSENRLQFNALRYYKPQYIVIMLLAMLNFPVIISLIDRNYKSFI
jgi:ubiquinone/menaquinone biosynthesis C-methylase UbiE